MGFPILSRYLVYGLDNASEEQVLRFVRFNPTPLLTIREAPAKKLGDRESLKMTTPAIPAKTTSDIKITDPSAALQNLNPWFMRI